MKTSRTADVQLRSRLITPGICALLAGMVWIVFGQTLRHQFINYDDGMFVYENANINAGLNPHAIAWAFTHSLAGNWHPLTTISHMLDCQVYGLRPWGHHLTNVLLHAAATILLFLALRQMTGAHWRSAFVAAVFAVHPLHVESVAWVAERKDVLSGVFFMFTLWAYTRYAQNPPSRARYALVTALYALGLMCKPTLVTLPFVLLLLDWWPLGRFPAPGDDRNYFFIPRRLLVEKIPLFILSACACVATLLAQEKALRMVMLSFPEQIGNALVSFMIYLQEMIWPADLAALYPHPAGNLPFWEVLLAILLLSSISTVVFVMRKKYPFLLMGWLWYLGMLIPMIGLVQAGTQGHADRYTYLPQIGLYIAVAWMVAGLCANMPDRRIIPAAASLIVIATLMWRAWIQTSYWQDSITLWNHALEVTMDNSGAQYNLGIALVNNGQADESVPHFLKALEIDPDFAEAHNNLGCVFQQMGEMDKATANYLKAAEINPGFAEAHSNLGYALQLQGHVDEAIAEYLKALEITPNALETRLNLGIAFRQKGEMHEALAQFQKAVDINPGSAKSHNDLGLALLQSGAVDEAIGHFHKALEIEPGYGEAQYNLSLALQQKDK